MMKLTYYFEQDPDTKYEEDEFKEFCKSNYSDHIYSLYAAVSRNQVLEQAILESRKNLGIPQNGITWQEFQHHKKYKAVDTSQEIWRILNSLDIVDSVYPQLNGLILGGFICLDENIMMGLQTIHGFLKKNTDETDVLSELIQERIVQGKSVSAIFESIEYKEHITAMGNHLYLRLPRHFSINQAKKYLENHWPDVSNLQNQVGLDSNDFVANLKKDIEFQEKLKSDPEFWGVYLKEIEDSIKLNKFEENFLISERDFEIYDMRELRKISFEGIARNIYSKCKGDHTVQISKESIRTALHRTKKKIRGIASIGKASN